VLGSSLPVLSGRWSEAKAVILMLHGRRLKLRTRQRQISGQALSIGNKNRHLPKPDMT